MVGVFGQLLAAGGKERAAAVLRRLGQQAADAGLTATKQVTTITSTPSRWRRAAVSRDENIERTYRRLLRWNAAVMVQRAQRPAIAVGGHISTYAGATTCTRSG